MDGEGDAGGGCSGEIGEVRVDSWIARGLHWWLTDGEREDQGAGMPPFLLVVATDGFLYGGSVLPYEGKNVLGGRNVFGEMCF